MNDDVLIHLVQKYEELYNLKHRYYHNHTRRDNIWDEIGEIMNESGKTCRDRWTKIRDNHRKALQLRKTKSGQAASQMKPPKYDKELNFLIPYLQDDENRSTNILSNDPSIDETTEQSSLNSPSSPVLSPYASPQCNSFDYQSCSAKSSTKRARSTKNSAETSTASVLKEYLECRARTWNTQVTPSSTSYPDENDPLIGFFINMARTVKDFPINEQVKIKNEVFSIVNNAELKLAMQVTAPESMTLTYSSPVPNYTHPEQIRIRDLQMRQGESPTKQTTVIRSQTQCNASSSSHVTSNKAVQKTTELLSHPQLNKSNANVEKTSTLICDPQMIQSNVNATSSTHQTKQAVENSSAKLSQPQLTMNNMNSLTPLHEIQVLPGETFSDNTYTVRLTESDLANYLVFNEKPSSKVYNIE